MHNKKFFFSIILVFIFTYLVDFVLHNIFLHDSYIACLDLWRPQSDIFGLLHLSIIVHLIFSLILVQFFKDFVFTKKKVTLPMSLAAGLFVGEMVGLIQLSSYIFMPVTPTIAISWFTGRIMQCVGGAYFIHKIYQR